VQQRQLVAQFHTLPIECLDEVIQAAITERSRGVSLNSESAANHGLVVGSGLGAVLGEGEGLGSGEGVGLGSGEGVGLGSGEGVGL
jgi:hypothetical protein